MATRYHDLEISGEFASCHLLGTGRIVSPSYTNAMKGSCKVFPSMEILAAFVLALYGLSSWSSSKKLNLRASVWLEWENKTTFFGIRENFHLKYLLTLHSNLQANFWSQNSSWWYQKQGYCCKRKVFIGCKTCIQSLLKSMQSYTVLVTKILVWVDEWLDSVKLW